MLAYHRVGARSAAKFNASVYTADAGQLDRHIRYFKQHCRLVDLEEALALAAGRERAKGTAVLLTFDDGYLDNYETAFPVLRAHRASAVFFLVSSFVEGNALPWWDQISGAVKAAPVKRFSLPAPGGSEAVFNLTGDRDTAAEAVLDFFKASRQSPESFLRVLSERCECAPPQAGAERIFLSWGQAREMQAAGMSIGGHTHTHPILATLHEAQQRTEIESSKQILERELGQRVEAMAYPVGGPADFDAATVRAASACGYRAAFSCHGGLNTPGNTQLFDIKRIPLYWDANPEWLLDPE